MTTEDRICTIFGEIMKNAVKDECSAQDEWLLARIDRSKRAILANHRRNASKTEIAA